LHASLQDVSDAKLPGDLRQVFRRALVTLMDVREMTFKSAILDKRVRISSWDTVGKVALALSSLKFLKGSTAMLFSGAAGVDRTR